jgi:hypothetical protein
MVASAGATFISILTMGAGHGTNLPAYIMVPWAMILLIADQTGTSMVLVAMLAQYPIYGAILGFRWRLWPFVLVPHFIDSMALLWRDGVIPGLGH